MPDSRFFESLGPLALADLASLAGAEAPVGEAGSRQIDEAAPLDRAGPRAVAFFADRRYGAQLEETGAGACFVTAENAPRLPAGCAALVTPEPQVAWALAAARLHRPWRHDPGDGAIHPSAEIGDGAVLHHGVVVGPKATIGAGSVLAAHVVIGPGVQLGKDCIVRPNVSIGHALIGERVKISAGAVIGEAGFGVAGGRRGAIDIPQLGRVVIEDDVSIGACTCVDRGAWGDTVIGAGSKIDNQVQVAHNCRLGRSVVLAGHVGLSGSVTVGDGVQMGGSVEIADHLEIGAGAMVAARAGVMHDIPAGEIWAGTPAKPIRKFMREQAWLAKMAAGREKTPIMSTGAPTPAAGAAISYGEILRRLPHRYPFLLIDRAEAYVERTSIVGIKNVTFNEPFFPGHFPQDPVMPGVLVIESMAQTGALLMGKSLAIDPEGKSIMLMSVDNARFRSPVRPGDQLRMPVQVTRARGDVFKFAGRALIGERLAAECEFAAMVVETPRD